jgi:hypothetical protein
MGQCTMRQYHGLPMIQVLPGICKSQLCILGEQAGNGFSHMECRGPHTPTLLGQDVTGGAC